MLFFCKNFIGYLKIKILTFFIYKFFPSANNFLFRSFKSNETQGISGKIVCMCYESHTPVPFSDGKYYRYNGMGAQTNVPK